MTKHILIETCEECPYVVPLNYSEDPFTIYFKCSHSKFPYGKSNWAIKDQILDDCPLDNYEPSNGDLTPEDIKRINATAEAIKDAKNVRECRFGCDPLHVHQSCTECNYGVYKVDLTRSQNTMKEIEHPTYREFCLNCIVRIHENICNGDITTLNSYQIGRDLTFLELTIRNQEDLDVTMPPRGKAFKRYEPRE